MAPYKMNGVFQRGCRLDRTMACHLVVEETDSVAQLGLSHFLKIDKDKTGTFHAASSHLLI